MSTNTSKAWVTGLEGAVDFFTNIVLIIASDSSIIQSCKGVLVMKRSLKKIIPVLIAVLLATSVAGCRNDAEKNNAAPSTAVETTAHTENQSTDDEAIATIPLTAETAKEREAMRKKGADHMFSEENFRNVLTMLQSRQGQEFPQTDTKNKQGHTVIANNDVYTLEKERADSVIIYLHGGAYAFGVSEKQIKFCDTLAERINAKVYIPLYPLTPQATYHDAYPFLDAVYDEALRENKPVYFVGDSAGGGLALAFAQQLRDRGAQLPKKMILLSPWVDLSLSDPDVPAYEEKDLQLDAYGLVELGRLWAAELDLKDPLISPLYGDLKNLPPTMLFCGTDDIMAPDNTKLFHQMKDAANNCSLTFGEGLGHVFVIEDIPEAERAQDMIVDFCKSY